MFRAASPIAPNVDLHRIDDSDAYFARFFSSASLATTPAPTTALLRRLTAVVSGHVKSHTRQQQRDQGNIVIPSGRFPSVRVSDMTKVQELQEYRPMLTLFTNSLTVLCRDVYVGQQNVDRPIHVYT